MKYVGHEQSGTLLSIAKITNFKIGVVGNYKKLKLRRFQNFGNRNNLFEFVYFVYNLRHMPVLHGCVSSLLGIGEGGHGTTAPVASVNELSQVLVLCWVPPTPDKAHDLEHAPHGPH